MVSRRPIISVLKPRIVRFIKLSDKFHSVAYSLTLARSSDDLYRGRKGRSAGYCSLCIINENEEQTPETEDTGTQGGDELTEAKGISKTFPSVKPSRGPDAVEVSRNKAGSQLMSAHRYS